MQLAQKHPELNVIGLGAQSSLDNAQSFVERTGTGTGDLHMVWDSTFESWRAFGVRSQPYWILFDSSGEIVASSPGAIDESAVASVL